MTRKESRLLQNRLSGFYDFINNNLVSYCPNFG